MEITYLYFAGLIALIIVGYVVVYKIAQLTMVCYYFLLNLTVAVHSAMVLSSEAMETSHEND